MAATLNLIAIPMLAGLVAGGGALASHVGGSASVPSEVATSAARSCAAQTWPYLDGKRLSRAPARPVRVVTAPRTDELTDAPDSAAAAAAPQPSVSAPDQLGAGSGLTSGDAVLHAPRAMPVNALPVKKPHTRRSERSSDRVARVYQVPSEARSGSGAVIVVRPLRLDSFR